MPFLEKKNIVLKFLFRQPIDLSLVMRHSHVSLARFSANQMTFFVVCLCSLHEFRSIYTSVTFRMNVAVVC